MSYHETENETYSLGEWEEIAMQAFHARHDHGNARDDARRFLDMVNRWVKQAKHVGWY